MRNRLPQTHHPRQVPAPGTEPLVPLGPELSFPANEPGPVSGDEAGPACCPTCGRLYALFSLRASGVLDLVLLAKEALSDIQRCVEEDVLP